MDISNTLVETVHARITLFGSGSVFVRVSYQDSEQANDIEGTLVLRSDDGLGDAVDELSRILGAWAALGRVGLFTKPEWTMR